LTIDHDGNPIVVYDYRTTEGHSEIYLQRSQDGGKTWPSDQKYHVVGDATLSAINPKIEMHDNGKRGAIIIEQENQPDPIFYSIDLIDIENPSTWNLTKFDLSFQTSWLGEIDGSIFGSHTASWSWIGDMKYEDYDYNETFHVNWATNIDDPETLAGLFFLIENDIQWYSHPTSAAGLYLYGAAQKNLPTGSQVMVTRAPWDDLVFENWKYTQIGSSRSNTTNPRLAASGEYGYLALQDDVNGNEDIYCYTPTRIGWQKNTVADTAEDEMYPSITAFGKTAICTFVKNGNLYMSRSDDAGISWGEAIQINDENNQAIEHYRCSSIKGPYITWADNRNGNSDIFFDTTELPWTVISKISGGLGVSGSLSNVGTEDASLVPWELSINGGILGLLNNTYSGEIDIPKGNTVSVGSGLFFGLGPIRIMLIADNAVIDTEATQLIIQTVI
jgi:hypothetical protein